MNILINYLFKSYENMIVLVKYGRLTFDSIITEQNNNGMWHVKKCH